MDADGTAYVCGLMVEQQIAECRAVRPDSGTVLWKTEPDSETESLGGALVEGRLYLTTAGGRLFAFGR